MLVGAIVGFLAGLFGIGGGLVIVPTLVYLLPMMGIPDQMLMSTALGTSFATIVITGFSSAQRHHKLGNIVLECSESTRASDHDYPYLSSGLFTLGKLRSVMYPLKSFSLFSCLFSSQNGHFY